jgi:hypothetical protein
MGLKEYIQEELNLRDRDLIRSAVRPTITRRFYLEGAPGLYGNVEFSPEDSTLNPQVTGPFCIWHDRRPTPKGFDDHGGAQGWIHISKQDNKIVQEPCNLAIQLSQREVTKLLWDGAEQVIKHSSRSRETTG